MSATTSPSLQSWVPVPAGNDFPIQNLPYGIFRTGSSAPRAGVAIGEMILDLAAASEKGLLASCGINTAVFSTAALNDFISLGQPAWTSVREKLSEILRSDASSATQEIVRSCLVAQKDAEMLMPVHIGDYTDFYSSIDHATNMGKMFRDPANALLPNWKHIPVGYHGRASSVVISGTPIHRPKGQMKPADSEIPVFGASKLLDFELETAFIIGKPTHLGESVSTASAASHIFGMVLFNDWSARDIQSWEYVPLGPFLAKNFGSTISPWIVTMEALEPFRVKGYVQEPKVLPYLQYSGDKNIDIHLEVSIRPENAAETVVSRSNYKYMYWTMEQQLAHHTVNGCNINVGDMMASGTISGPEEGSFGSMMEITWRGTKPVQMTDGSERKFINDNDTVIIRGWSEKDGVRIGFGECAGKILPAV